MVPMNSQRSDGDFEKTPSQGGLHSPAGSTDERQPGQFTHAPVLAAEVVQGFRDRRTPSTVIVDATVGLAGHSQRILDELDWAEVIGIDRDRRALEQAQDRLSRYGGRARLVHARFGEISDAVAPVAAVAGVLADLGVSSMQLDDPGRGFSFRFDAPLDMRMDPDGEDADVAGFLLAVSTKDLIRIFRENGVGTLSIRYANALKSQLPVATTGELAEIIVSATPARLRGGRTHPATKVFQALRVSVNYEASELIHFLPAALGLLDRGGVMQVISYHSGEDRLVKRFIRLVETGGCICPPRLGCTCGAEPAGERTTRHAIIPSDDELAANPRSRSARMRALRRTANDVADVLERYWQQVPTWHG
jgi:16S rRNA (cytosine1402-N4)-methyltransferase